MSQFPHDEFAKGLFDSLLSPLGEVKIQLAIASEVRAADIYFTPNSQVVVTSDIGLLGQCATGSVVFEPFRNPVGIREIRSCMSKLYDLHGDLIRQSEKKARKSPMPNCQCCGF